MIIIDRIEEGSAVCENGGERLILPLSALPGAKEGDVLVCGEDGWQVDAEATARRRETIRSRTQRRRRRPPKDTE